LKYYYPWEVYIRIIDGQRRAFLYSNNQEVVIGPPEKMSKSKKNVVDFDRFMQGEIHPKVME